MCSQTRNSCAKAFDNQSRSKNLKPKKSSVGGEGSIYIYIIYMKKKTKMSKFKIYWAVKLWLALAKEEFKCLVVLRNGTDRQFGRTNRLC